MNPVEEVTDQGRLLALIARAEMAPEKTTFLTPNETQFQLGYVVYPKGGEVPRHIHLPIERRIQGTTEVLFIKKGRCIADFYSDTKELVASREVKAGDMILMVSGGHGFRMLEDTILMEIKQGPYTGLVEKERF